MDDAAQPDSCCTTGTRPSAVNELDTVAQMERYPRESRWNGSSVRPRSSGLDDVQLDDLTVSPLYILNSISS